MAYLIFKPTRRERDERLRETASRSSQPGVRGVVRRTEEAYEVSRQIERETGKQDFYAVSADAPESKRAEGEAWLRNGVHPDAVERALGKEALG